MTEIRWILLAAGVVLIVGIWWRAARRDGQAQPSADLRDPLVGPTPVPTAPQSPQVGAHLESVDWGVSPLEPLTIKTADYDKVPVLDMPMRPERAHPAAAAPDSDGAAGLAETTVSFAAFDIVQPASRTAPGPRAAATGRGASGVRRDLAARGDDSGRFRAAEPKPANRSELQKIISLRICTLGDARWSGAQLLEALEHEGLAHGRYQVFHRRHVDGTSLFCVASLIEPGSFDLAAMPTQEFRGVSAFAVLPGAVECVPTVEGMIATSRRLAERLSGMVQDGKGMPLSPQRAGALLEEAARFQALLA